MMTESRSPSKKTREKSSSPARSTDRQLFDAGRKGGKRHAAAKIVEQGEPGAADARADSTVGGRVASYFVPAVLAVAAITFPSGSILVPRRDSPMLW